MDLNLLNKNDRLPFLIRKSLAPYAGDFARKWQNIRHNNHSGQASQLAAGVLLLLCHRGGHISDPREPGAWVLQLIKRSPLIAQGGDVSCPGGMLHPLIDWAFGLFFIRSGVLPCSPLSFGSARAVAASESKNIISLFLANALRESWEELHLNPLHVSLLGSLPTYSLHLFRRTIFPLVAIVRNDWTPIPNSEVDKIIEIPLTNFFREDSYGRYMIQASETLPTPDQGPWEFPCLIHEDDDGEEILWGATFYIIMSFLQIVFDFQLPDLHSRRIREKTLNPDYLTGNR
ncbi:MAG: CoA pyrophosphatase [Deltaproteobacteria bacterium]|nr:CoA pyrophosphatase [Deltaproteobacteria bacterium]